MPGGASVITRYAKISHGTSIVKLASDPLSGRSKPHSTVASPGGNEPLHAQAFALGLGHVLIGHRLLRLHRHEALGQAHQRAGLGKHVGRGAEVEQLCLLHDLDAVVLELDRGRAEVEHDHALVARHRQAADLYGVAAVAAASETACCCTSRPGTER